jgi:predicted anti-sigma-YlaC factor YlaD
MDCKHFQEMLPDLAAGMEGTTPEVEKHLAGCAACSTQLQEFRETMALLDEWQAPEPSTYFDTRLAARLREEMARPQLAWYERLLPGLKSHPVWLTSVAAVIFVAAVAVGNKSYIVQTDEIATNPPALTVPVQPGTAVGDLQALEKNDDLYADFDMLDDLQVQDDDVTATP